MDKPFAIFDMDGTLADSMWIWQDLEREFLIRKGVTTGLEAILERAKPLILKEAMALIAECCHLQSTPEEMMEEILSIMEEHYRTDVLLKPGVIPYLDRLQARGIPMCVASATPTRLIHICLERLGLAKYFQFVLSCVDIGVGKKQPDIFLLAAEQLGTSPSQCAVYEDSMQAIRTAHDVGFYTVAIRDRCNDDSWEEMCSLADESIIDWSQAQ